MRTDRMVHSDLAEQLLAAGIATEAGLRRISRGWRTWAGADDGWFSVMHGEVLCQAERSDGAPAAIGPDKQRRWPRVKMAASWPGGWRWR